MQYLYVCIYSYFLLFQNGKGVPVILPPDAKKPLQYLTNLEVRKKAGIQPSNPYIFASTG